MNDYNNDNKNNIAPSKPTNGVETPGSTIESEDKTREFIAEQMISRQYSGPVPDAESMAEYKKIDPEFPNRLLTMAEIQAKHRQKVEGNLIDSDYRLKRKGQDYALFGLISLAGLATYLVYSGATTEAATVASIAIVAIVGIFVTGRNKKTSNDPNQ